MRYAKLHRTEKKTIVVNISGHGLMDMKIFDGEK